MQAEERVQAPPLNLYTEPHDIVTKWTTSEDTDWCRRPDVASTLIADSNQTTDEMQARGQGDDLLHGEYEALRVVAIHDMRAGEHVCIGASPADCRRDAGDHACHGLVERRGGQPAGVTFYFSGGEISRVHWQPDQPFVKTHTAT